MAFFNKGFLLAGFLALAPILAFGQSLEEGVEAYQRGNYINARKYLEPFAEQGNATAQAYIGAIYAEGYGVPKNSQEAIFWWRLAAEQGNALGQTSLGLMYEIGEGVPQNYPEAVAWYRLAAEQGAPVAQNQLGTMYETGKGVPQNYREAVSWYRLAAEQGSEYAQFQLSGMYYQGRGVSRNDVMAYMLTVLAAAQGHETARQVRDIILETLSREQVEEGQRFATEWRVGSPLPTFHDFSTWP